MPLNKKNMQTERLVLYLLMIVFKLNNLKSVQILKKRNKQTNEVRIYLKMIGCLVNISTGVNKSSTFFQ